MFKILRGLFKSTKSSLPKAPEVVPKPQKVNSVHVSGTPATKAELMYGTRIGGVHKDGSMLYKRTCLAKGRGGIYVSDSRRTLVDKNGKVKKVIEKSKNPEVGTIVTETTTTGLRAQKVERNWYSYLTGEKETNTWYRNPFASIYDNTYSLGPEAARFFE